MCKVRVNNNDCIASYHSKWWETSNFSVKNIFLPVSYDNKVEHYRVMRDKKNWVTVDDEEYFENLFKLVEVSQQFPNKLTLAFRFWALD